MFTQLSRHHFRRRQAFTLLELLLAVVVIGILATLVLAVFAGAQDKSYQAALQNDLKIFATSQALHVAENDAFADGSAALPGFFLSEGVYEISRSTEGATRWRLVLGHEKTNWRCSMQGGPGAEGSEAKAPVCVDGRSMDFDVSTDAPVAGEMVTFFAEPAIIQMALAPTEASAWAAHATDVADIASLVWSYGDGTAVDGGDAETHLTRSHAYENPGEYTATLTVTTHGGDEGVASKQIQVSPRTDTAPTAAFTHAVDGLLVRFDASASASAYEGGLTFEWDYGDGSSSTPSDSPTSEHTYTVAAARTVELTVTDAMGNVTSVFQEVSPNAPPIAMFDFAPHAPEAGDTVVFDGSASYDPEGGALNYAWDFGWAGNAEAPVAKAALAEGPHSVRLSVEDEQGNVGVREESLVVAPAAEVHLVAPDDTTHSPGTTGTRVFQVRNRSIIQRSFSLEVASSTSRVTAVIEGPLTRTLSPEAVEDVVVRYDVAVAMNVGASASITVVAADESDASHSGSASFSVTTELEEENLVINGDGRYGSDHNFGSFAFVAEPFDDVYGYFTVNATGARTFFNNQAMVPVDTLVGYNLSLLARRPAGSNAHNILAGFALYDRDGLLMDPSHFKRVADARLAQPLSPGDTVVYLTNVDGWGNTEQAGVYRTLTIWGYKDSSGESYGDYTYTRRVLSRAWNGGAVDAATNSIRLAAPLPASMGNPDHPDGTWPLGHAVSNGSDGGTYKYCVAMQAPLDTEWVRFSGTIRGVDHSGGHEACQLAPGTAFLRPVYLMGYSASAFPVTLQIADVKMAKAP